MSEREGFWEELAERMRAIPGAPEVRCGEPMRRHTTFQVGGPAAIFAEPKSAEQLAELRRLCREEEVPCFLLGRGSNLLVSDEGYAGVILHLGEAMSRVQVEGEQVQAEAGVMLSALARAVRDQGLTGLEFAAGIPGTLGGALAMNAGAYGGEMKDVVREVLVLDDADVLSWMPARELSMGYRTSRIQREGLIALAARLTLSPGDPEEIQNRMNDLAERRRSKQPLEYPSAGSTFKRPEGYFAGKLIQDAGLAGFAVGGACVSEKHCGFVINRGGATAADILAVCRHAEEEVLRQFGVQLEKEVRLLGFSEAG